MHTRDVHTPLPPQTHTHMSVVHPLTQNIDANKEGISRQLENLYGL